MADTSGGARILAGLNQAGLRLPVTPNMTTFLQAWQNAEGTRAANNPFADTLKMPGSTAFNWNAGTPVQNYTTPEQGWAALNTTLTSPIYSGLLSAMRSNAPASHLAQMVASGPWGTHDLPAALSALTGGAAPPAAPAAPTVPAAAPAVGPNPAAGARVLPAASVMNPMLARLSALHDPLQGMLNRIQGLAGMPHFALPSAPVIPSLPAQTPTQDVHVGLTDPIPANASTSVRRVLALAKSYQAAKTPYVFGAERGGTGPGHAGAAFDCSGFAQYLYAQVGVHIPRTSEEQARAGRGVRVGQQQPGDLLFFNTEGSDPASHVGIYVGDDQFIAAPHTGAVVSISNLSDPYYASRLRSVRRMV